MNTSSIPDTVPAMKPLPSLRRRLCVAGALSVPLGALNLPARAHQGHGTPRAAPATGLPPEQKPWGIAGDPRQVSRTVQILMTDDMRFSSARIAVREGETLRLRAINRGRMLHEIVLGTVAEIEAHAELMKKYPGMEHEEPWMAHVPAGRRADLVWHFNRPGRVDFACLVDDHYELGMAGRIDVQPRAG